MALYAVALASLLAGLGVLAATAIARHRPGPWSGLLAAAPITPTVAYLLAWSQGTRLDLLDGLAPVVATLLLLAASGAVAKRWSDIPTYLFLLVGVPPLALIITTWVPMLPLLVLLPLAAGIGLRSLPARVAITATRVGGLSVLQRFAIGALPILLIAFLIEVAPGLAALVAMLPVLFVAALAAAHLDGGPTAAAHMARGGIGGSVAVAMFAMTVHLTGAWAGPVAILAGWTAFGATGVAAVGRDAAAGRQRRDVARVRAATR